MTDNPLITFAILSYNQEKYIRQAIQAALAQDYSPLEIIVSDDCSVDGTAEIIRRVIASYQGPHSIVVNVNARNLGIGAHVNKVFDLARGDLIVMAGGDDISHPNRTRKIVQRWIERDQAPSAIYCGARRMNADGKLLTRAVTELQVGSRDAEHLMTFKHPKRMLAIGACGAYSPETMRRFGQLDPGLPIEDIPLVIRASMLGGIEYVDEDLVDYRTNVSVWRDIKMVDDDFAKRLKRRQFYTFARLQVAKQVLRDAVVTGDDRYIRAATRGYLVHAFVRKTCENQSMNFKDYLATGLASGHWTYTFAAGFLDGHPLVHQFLFGAKQILLSLARRVTR